MKLTSRETTPDDFAAARAWCNQSEAHTDAFRRARRFWRQTGPAPAPATQSIRWSSQALAAAAIALCVGLAALTAHLEWTADHRTSTTARQISLDDGSKILLDAGSALDIRYSQHRRLIRLRRGRALFTVMPDASRPFVVDDGEFTATALGTVYAVRQLESGSQVTVREGKVSVAGKGETVTLLAGEQATSSAEHLAQSKVDVEQSMAWEHGQLTCKLMPLEEVIAELNRRRPGILLIGDDRLRELRVSGTFRLDASEETLAALRTVFPIDTLELSRYLIVLRYRDSEPPAS